MSGNDSLKFIPALLSLQESAINTIVKNIGGYRDLLRKAIISPPMRKMVFEIAMERRKEIGEDQVWAALPYLDQHRTTESFSTKDFASIFRLKGKKGKISKGHVSMEEFLQYLFEFVPNLKQLKIQDPRTSWSKRCAYEKIEREPLATDLLLKMENLTQLSINGVNIQFSGFMCVYRASRNLQSIRADNILVDVSISSMRRILEAIDPTFDQQEYDALEYQSYPKKLGISLKKTFADEPHREAKYTQLNDFLDLLPSGLTKLYISAFKFDPVNNEVTQSERNCLLRNLPRLGGTIKTLILHDMRLELNVSMQYILEHCPELETLEIQDVCLSFDEPITSFAKLKNFKAFNRVRVGTLRLDKLFSAPLLQHIDINAIQFDLGDREPLLTRIRNRSILTDLTSIRIIGCVINRKEVRSKSEEFRELAFELDLLGVSVNASIHHFTR